jgi:hypothetical protein
VMMPARIEKHGKRRGHGRVTSCRQGVTGDGEDGSGRRSASARKSMCPGTANLTCTALRRYFSSAVMLVLKRRTSNPAFSKRGATSDAHHCEPCSPCRRANNLRNLPQAAAEDTRREPTARCRSIGGSRETCPFDALSEVPDARQDVPAGMKQGAGIGAT